MRPSQRCNLSVAIYAPELKLCDLPVQRRTEDRAVNEFLYSDEQANGMSVRYATLCDLDVVAILLACRLGYVRIFRSSIPRQINQS